MSVPAPSTPVRRRQADLAGAGTPAVVAGVVTAAVVAPLLGATTAAVVGDPGDLVRWGIPLLSPVRTVLLAATVGLLGLAAFLVPDRARTARRELATRLAAVTAAGWTLTSLVLLVLTFADLAGTPVGSPGFGTQLLTFVWSVEVTRVLAVQTLLALAATALASLARSRTAMAWACVLALASVAVLSLNGHAAGAADHENAVNAVAVHVLAATVWLGGLLALVALRRALGADLPPVVARFSTVALWCYATTALSGVLQAWLRLGSWDGLLTTYGLVLVAKAALLGVLGVLGWRQRARMLTRLRADARDSRAFARLAVTETVLLGVAAGLGAALSRGVPPMGVEPPVADRVVELTGYPDPGPMAWADWVTAWRVDWLLLGVSLLATGVYVAGWRRLRARGDAWPLHRVAAWVAGWVLFAWATNGAPAIWGRVTFSTHMVMHMVVAMFVPLLLVPGAPVTLALRALAPRRDRTWGPREVVLQVAHSRLNRLLANPVVAAVLFFVSLAIFYFSPAFELALTTHTGHLLMLAHFLLTGYLFTWMLIGIDPGPRRWSPLVLLVILFITISFHAFFGVALTGSSRLLAPDFFQRLALPWLTDPAADQVRAGEIAWGTGELPTVILAFLVARQWFTADRQESERRDRQADRDDDAELRAYNEMLAARRAMMERRERMEP